MQVKELEQMTQQAMWDGVRYDGSDYVADRDDDRLTGQLKRIWRCMRDGTPRSLHEIATITGDPEASISAQLRHLRKERFGGHEVTKEYQGGGLYLYVLTVKEEVTDAERFEGIDWKRAADAGFDG